MEEKGTCGEGVDGDLDAGALLEEEAAAQ